MDTAKLNDWMQVFGIFALVASLVFVGMQMRQEHEIARVMIYQSRASNAAEILASAASNPDAAVAVINTAFGDPNKPIQMDGWAAPITAKDIYLGRLQAQSFLTLTDNSFYQYQNGFLPEDHWQSVRSTVKNVLSDMPFIRYHVETTLDERRPAFREELIKMLAEIDDERAE